MVFFSHNTHLFKYIKAILSSTSEGNESTGIVCFNGIILSQQISHLEYKQELTYPFYVYLIKKVTTESIFNFYLRQSLPAGGFK